MKKRNKAQADRGQESSLDKLRDMTVNLPELPVPHADADCQGHIEYQAHEGTSVAWCLLSESAVSVAKWFTSAGTTTPEHAHEGERHVFAVYDGILLIEFLDTNERIEVGRGEAVTIDPGRLHKATALKDAWVVAISMPRSKSWPKP